MVNGRPLFPGQSEADQLNRIFKLLGTPSLRTWPGMADLPEYKANFTVYPPQNNWKKVCRRLDREGRDLLNSFLQYDPMHRISAEEAMKHPYFKELKKRRKKA